MNKLNSIFLPS